MTIISVIVGMLARLGFLQSSQRILQHLQKREGSKRGCSTSVIFRMPFFDDSRCRLPRPAAFT